MKIKILILIFLFSSNIKAQNLVLNASFEDTIPCGQFNAPPQMIPVGWVMVKGSVDYFSLLNDCFAYPVPSNWYGYQNPATGIAYCGLALFGAPNVTFPHFREYIEGVLIDTLKQGHLYCVSFYAVKADSGRYYTDDIGLYFSVDSVVDSTSLYYLPFIPQIVNNNGILYDTLNWTLVSGAYVAQGGEKYLTIGNFTDDLNITLDSNNQAPNSNTLGSYYYIDDVSVIDCTVGINDIEEAKYSIQLFPNPSESQTVYSINLSAGETAYVKIISQYGTRLHSFNILDNPNQSVINTSGYSPGIYVVQTEINNKIIDRRKLVVIK